MRWQGGRSNDFIHAFASLAQTVLRMGGFYHSVLTAHQLLKGIQSNIQKNGGGRAVRNAFLFEELKPNNRF